MICPGLALPLALANGPQAEMVRYAARPGETLASIAARGFYPVCGSGAVARINHLPKNGPLLPGQTVLIPRILLRTEQAQGVLEGFRGPVVVRLSGRSGGAPHVGDRLGEGAVIETGADASARIALQDGSRIAIPSNSRVRVDRLRMVVLTGALDRAFFLLDGRADSTVTPMKDTTGRYVVSTPVAVSAVRGTVFRSAYDARARMGSSGVLQGVVAVTGGGREVLLHANEGVTATPSGISDPKPLPPPPILDHADHRQAGEAAGFDIRPTTGIVRHHIRIVTDASQDVRETEQANAHVSLVDLPEGDFTAVVTDIAPGGLEGLPTTVAFTHQRYDLAGLRVREERSPGETRYTFAWKPLGVTAAAYRFTLVRATAPGLAVIDRAGLTDTAVGPVGLPPGDYRWQVTASWTADGKAATLASDPQPLTVDAPDR